MTTHLLDLKGLRLFSNKQNKLFQKTDYICGIYKVAQNFIIELLSESRSNIYLPTRGCNFIKGIINGARTEFFLIALFNASVNRIKKTFKVIQRNLPPKDQFDKAELLQLFLSDNSLVLELKIYNKAGECVIVSTPKIIINEILDE